MMPFVNIPEKITTQKNCLIPIFFYELFLAPVIDRHISSNALVGDCRFPEKSLEPKLVAVRHGENDTWIRKQLSAQGTGVSGAALVSRLNLYGF
jgi:hypothetical protein